VHSPKFCQNLASRKRQTRTCSDGTKQYQRDFGKNRSLGLGNAIETPEIAMLRNLGTSGRKPPNTSRTRCTVTAVAGLALFGGSRGKFPHGLANFYRTEGELWCQLFAIFGIQCRSLAPILAQGDEVGKQSMRMMTWLLLALNHPLAMQLTGLLIQDVGVSLQLLHPRQKLLRSTELQEAR
jgi:hypothetical protein